MYLIDTNIISEIRKRNRANTGVRNFFKQVIQDNVPVYVSVVTIGELRRGIELIRHRGDTKQANRLEQWLLSVLEDYQNNILDLDKETAQLWGKLRVPHHENALDKQIAATALIHGLTVVSRNREHFTRTGVKVLNPFKKKI